MSNVFSHERKRFSSSKTKLNSTSNSTKNQSLVIVKSEEKETKEEADKNTQAESLLKESHRLRSQIKLRQLEDQISLYEAQLRSVPQSDGEAIFSARERRDEALSELNIVRSQLGLLPINIDGESDGQRSSRNYSSSLINDVEVTKTVTFVDDPVIAVVSNKQLLESSSSLDDYESRLRLFEARLLDEKESLKRREAALGTLVLKIQQDEEIKKKKKEEERGRGEGNLHLLEDNHHDVRVMLSFDASPRANKVLSRLPTSESSSLSLLPQHVNALVPKISALEAAVTAAAHQTSFSSAMSLMNSTIASSLPSNVPERAILWDLVSTMVNEPRASAPVRNSSYVTFAHERDGERMHLLKTTPNKQRENNPITTTMIENGTSGTITSSSLTSSTSSTSSSSSTSSPRLPILSSQSLINQKIALPNEPISTNNTTAVAHRPLLSEQHGVSASVYKQHSNSVSSIATSQPSLPKAPQLASSSTTTTTTSSSSTAPTNYLAPLSPSLGKPSRPRSQPIQSWGT
jgi:hypothetical protein